MSGYGGAALEFLESRSISVGDTVRITAGGAYDGVVMPRYEGGDGGRIVLKLKSGYNISVEIDRISRLEKIRTESAQKSAAPDIARREGLPDVLLLSTGGTIASRIDYRTGAVTPAVTPEELSASVPELSEIANIDTRILFSEYSENLQPHHWRSIAEELDRAARSEYRGIIIAHGTDTMQYTSAYLSFALSGFPIPVAMVGSQRSSDRPSSDAALNLIAACRFLAGTRRTGIYVVMHHDGSDETMAGHAGTRVRKSHTSARGAFRTVGGEPAFLVSDGQVRYGSQDGFFRNERYAPRIGLETRVGLVKYHPGYDPKILDHMTESGYRAVIFEGTGLGHIGETMYESVRRAARRGLFLGMTSQCIDGRVRMTVYESGRDLLGMGIVPLGSMLPETALVKAMWAAGVTEDAGQMRELMLSDVASESRF